MGIDVETKRVLETITKEQWEAIAIIAQEKINQSESAPSKDSEIQRENQKDLSLKVKDVIQELGISPNLSGYKYLQEAVLLVCEDESYIKTVTKRLYPLIARKNGITSSKVERAIRHVLEVAFDYTDIEVIEKIFKGMYSPLRGRPTCSQAIAIIAEHVKYYA